MLFAKILVTVTILSSALTVGVVAAITPDCDPQIVNSMVLFPGDHGHDANGNQDGEPITICVVD